jgi:hypothetical protein
MMLIQLPNVMTNTTGLLSEDHTLYYCKWFICCISFHVGFQLPDVMTNVTYITEDDKMCVIMIIFANNQFWCWDQLPNVTTNIKGVAQRGSHRFLLLLSPTVNSNFGLNSKKFEREWPIIQLLRKEIFGLTTGEGTDPKKYNVSELWCYFV